ncbi:hypothetical protein DFH27DRAFT_111389 [Peziza echinospora]|nr:hypothetical protein DFH27DRAFT_111389 [Peziza echinospora]
MGLSSELISVGAGRIQGRHNSKEPGKPFQPRGLRPRYTEWPTLAIEVALSQSKRKKRADAAWWLSNSGGEVKTVVNCLPTIYCFFQYLLLEDFRIGAVSFERFWWSETRCTDGTVSYEEILL